MGLGRDEEHEVERARGLRRQRRALDPQAVLLRAREHEPDARRARERPRRHLDGGHVLIAEHRHALGDEIDDLRRRHAGAKGRARLAVRTLLDEALAGGNAAQHMDLVEPRAVERQIRRIGEGGELFGDLGPRALEHHGHAAALAGVGPGLEERRRRDAGRQRQGAGQGYGASHEGPPSSLR